MLLYVGVTIFRCQIPGLDNDTYSPPDSEHNSTILRYIPLTDEGKFNSCFVLNITANGTEAQKCSGYVYDTSIFYETTTTEVCLLVKTVSWIYETLDKIL